SSGSSNQRYVFSTQSALMEARRTCVSTMLRAKVTLPPDLEHHQIPDAGAMVPYTGVVLLEQGFNRIRSNEPMRLQPSRRQKFRHVAAQPLHQPLVYGQYETLLGSVKDCVRNQAADGFLENVLNAPRLDFHGARQACGVL